MKPRLTGAIFALLLSSAAPVSALVQFDEALDGPSGGFQARSFFDIFPIGAYPVGTVSAGTNWVSGSISGICQDFNCNDPEPSAIDTFRIDVPVGLAMSQVEIQVTNVVGQSIFYSDFSILSPSGQVGNTSVFMGSSSLLSFLDPLAPGSYIMRIEGALGGISGDFSADWRVTMTVVPLPLSGALLGAGLALLARTAHRRRKATGEVRVAT
jgi:hypothetical protein